MSQLKSFECTIEDWYGRDCVEHYIATTPAKARYKMYKEYSELLPKYAECFRWIKSKCLGVINASYLFGDVEMFDSVCLKRGITFAKQGMKVNINGKFGTVLGGNSHSNLDVLFDGQECSSNCHPHWEITYYDDHKNIIMDYKTA
jgi:hypothetical protein